MDYTIDFTQASQGFVKFTDNTAIAIKITIVAFAKGCFYNH